MSRPRSPNSLRLQGVPRSPVPAPPLAPHRPAPAIELTVAAVAAAEVELAQAEEREEQAQFHLQTTPLGHPSYYEADFRLLRENDRARAERARATRAVIILRRALEELEWMQMENLNPDFSVDALL